MMSLAVMVMLCLSDLALDLVGPFSEVEYLGEVKDLRSLIVSHILAKVFQALGWRYGELQLLHTIAIAIGGGGVIRV